MKSLGLVSAIASTVLMTLVARADVGPPPDYVDACAETPPPRDLLCVRCTLPEFKDRDCHARALATGHERFCRGWSYALLCRPSTTTEPGAGAPAASLCAAARPVLPFLDPIVGRYCRRAIL